MGLILARKLNEEIVLFAAPGADPALLIEQLTEGFTIRVHEVNDSGTNVKLDISAPAGIRVLRSELLDREP
ncbi:carbon storage regulator [Pseudomonas sp.]|uniref:carbon storage regulator n=1 Tax=Pseudomonas sp. TaxID=306 RepID=UPI002731A1DD|nr:carbon storage regulator [Pseudomonas sp.]MDP2446577.1 carbon storage regulator [Pseudomonas sp.]MDZ4334263.1 carbon storage regulator [Pseudomonas sp.]